MSRPRSLGGPDQVDTRRQDGEGGSIPWALSDYQLNGRLGRGGSGTVYKAIHRLKGHIVAVKVIPAKAMSKDEISSIEMEVRLMRVLQHPNIVTYIDSYIDWGKQGGDLYIVLEYVEGGSLSKIMHDTSDGTLPETLVTIYISRMLCGLVYLHGQGVIHRDIKAANILVDRDGGVRLADFGVAIKSTLQNGDATNDVVGTPYWMAPEVIQMTGATEKSDVWSVGCTVIELLTGAPPYATLPQVPALFRIVQDDHPPLPPLADTDEVLFDFLMVCFRRNQHQRASASTLSLHAWLDLDSKLARQTKKATGAGDRNQRNHPASSLVSNSDASSVPATTPTSANDRRGPWESCGQLYANSDTISRHRHLSDSIQSLRRENGNNLSGRASLREIGPEIPPRDPVKDSAAPALPERDESTRSIRRRGLPNSIECNTAVVAELARSKSPLLKIKTKTHTDKVPSSCGEHLKARPKGSIRTPTSAGLAQSMSAADIELEILPQSGETVAVQLEVTAKEEEITREATRLVGLLIECHGKDRAVKSACQDLALFLACHRSRKECLITQHAIIPLMEILEDGGKEAQLAALKLINLVTCDDVIFLQTLALAGLVPLVVKIGHPIACTCAGTKLSVHRGPIPETRDIRNAMERNVEDSILHEVAQLTVQLCRPQSSTFALQIFVASQGLDFLVAMLRCEFTTHFMYVHSALDAICNVFARSDRENSPDISSLKAVPMLPNPDIAHLLVKAHILPTLALMLTTLIRVGDEEQQERIVNILVQLVRAGEVVQRAIGQQPDVIASIIFGIDELTHCPDKLLKLLHCLTRLGMCPTSMDAMERAGAIKRLVRLTDQQLAEFYAFRKQNLRKVQNASLLCLYYICGGKAIRSVQFRARQEMAVAQGLISCLQWHINSHSEMEDIALQMFCALPYVGQRVRSQLWHATGHLFYLELLKHKQQRWRLYALEALALWMSDGSAVAPTRTTLERVLLEPKHVAKLVQAVTEAAMRVVSVVTSWFSADGDTMISMITPYVGLLSHSKSLGRASSEITSAVLESLTEHHDVQVVLKLLKLLLKIIEAHRSPATFVEQHSLQLVMHEISNRHANKPMVANIATAIACVAAISS